MFDSVLQQLAAVAVLVERGVQFIKSIVQYNQWAAAYQQYIDMAMTAGLNIGICLSWHVDLFAAANISLPYAWAGPVLTGVIASLGSNLLHEFVELLKGWRAGMPAFKK